MAKKNKKAPPINSLYGQSLNISQSTHLSIPLDLGFSLGLIRATATADIPSTTKAWQRTAHANPITGIR